MHDRTWAYLPGHELFALSDRLSLGGLFNLVAGHYFLFEVYSTKLRLSYSIGRLLIHLTFISSHPESVVGHFDFVTVWVKCIDILE